VGSILSPPVVPLDQRKRWSKAPPGANCSRYAKARPFEATTTGLESAPKPALKDDGHVLARWFPVRPAVRRISMHQNRLPRSSPT
jgi:hypothetical protein